MTEKPQFHGSDLELIEQYYHIPKEQIISFSANVNPLGISPAFRQSMTDHIDVITSYPDRAYKDLKEALSAYCGCPADHILPGSGVTELLSRFIREIRPKKALLVNPTYSEYEREIKLSGGLLHSFQLEEEKEFSLDIPALLSRLSQGYDLLILCNPNNPTGSALKQEELVRIFSFCQKEHIYVLVDETYIEFAADVEALTSVSLTGQFDNIFVLRGVSKFFASPGLRLGYAVTGNKDLKDRIINSQNPWGINSLAAACAPAMFADHDYIERTKQFTATERERLLQVLRKEPFLHVYEPIANFILIKILKDGVTSGAVFEHAIQSGLMLRDCSTFPGLEEKFIRFCFCLPEQNDKLVGKILEAIHGTENK